MPALCAATALGLALLVLRSARTGTHAYFFLAYNLALAWIPLGLSALTRFLARSRSPLAIPVGVAWWLFFPNAFYLVTDLVHYRVRPGVPFWYDVALVAAFASSGALLALASLASMHGLVRARWGALAGWAFVAFAAVSSGFGIWLGRVRRWNSWDVALHPLEVAADSARALAHPLLRPDAWGVTLAFGGLFAVLYVAMASMRSSMRAWD
jgi:uncharacterized membrane protein